MLGVLFSLLSDTSLREPVLAADGGFSSDVSVTCFASLVGFFSCNLGWPSAALDAFLLLIAAI
jgi:hypothetical protein